MTQMQLILMVGLEHQSEIKLAPVLGRTEFEVQREPDFARAVRLVEMVRFDTILVGRGQADDDLQPLLEAIRRPGSPSVAASVVLLLPPDEMPLARAYVAAGVSQVVPASAGATELQKVLLQLLRAKIRLELRAMTHLTVQLGAAATRVLCQTANLSRNGMFVVTDARFPLGAPVDFTLVLSSAGDMVSGQAQVVRHVSTSRSHDEGVGMRFVRFVGDGESRLAAFLDRYHE